MLQQPRAAVQGDRPTALVHAREGVGRACKASALPTTTLARTNNYKGGFNKKLGCDLTFQRKSIAAAAVWIRDVPVPRTGKWRAEVADAKNWPARRR